MKVSPVNNTLFVKEASPPATKLALKMVRLKVPLDDTAGCTEGKSMQDYCKMCSEELDVALESLDLQYSTDAFKVYCGKVRPDSTLISTMWVQEFDGNDPYISKCIDEAMVGDDIAGLAKRWDDTFDSADVVLNYEPEKNFVGKLIHWRYNARPLSGREMVYLACGLTEENVTTYAYASVSNAWCETNFDVKIKKFKGRERSCNLFPSCDRVTKLKNGKIRLEHLMTTSLGGWVPNWIFNVFFKKPLIQTYTAEAKHYRKFILDFAKECKDDAGEKAKNS